MKVEIIPPISLPRDLYWNESDTLRPGNVISYLRETYKESQNVKHMAFTESPLQVAIHHEWWIINGFIRGMGTLNGNESLVSTFKIKKELNGNKKIYYDLLSKVTRHEIGHNYGLSHCPNNKCVMVSGLDPEILYSAKNILCDSCSNILKPVLR